MKRAKKSTQTNINNVFKELYKDNLKDLIPRQSAWFGTVRLNLTPDDFEKKYGNKVWDELNKEKQDFIIKHGMKAWEKSDEFKDDFEDLLK